MATIVYHGSRAELGAIFRRLAGMLGGRVPDAHGVAEGFNLRLSTALLSQVQQDFLTKSRGDTGRDGIKWAPLSPKTIAYSRRITREEWRESGFGKRQGRRPSLTPAQDKRWRQVFARTLARFRLDGGSSEAEARAKAGSVAWATLKREGARTILGEFGGRQVDILRDTGLLFRSLSPGVEDRPSGEEGQVLRLQPGRLVVGTNVRPWHHAGVPGRLPARPLWPADGTIPPAWWPAVMVAAERGFRRAIELILARGRAA